MSASPSASSPSPPWFEDAAACELRQRLPHVAWLRPTRSTPRQPRKTQPADTSSSVALASSASHHWVGAALPPGWIVAPRQPQDVSSGSAAATEWVSQPAPMTTVTRAGKGACVVASRDISAGEVIVFDESLLVAVTDLAVSQQVQACVDTSARNSNNKRSAKQDALYCALELVKLATGQGCVLAGGVTAGSLQWVAALVYELVLHHHRGETAAQRRGDTSGERSVVRSHRIDTLRRLADEWCGTLSGERPANAFWATAQGPTAAASLDTSAKADRYRDLRAGAVTLLELLQPALFRMRRRSSDDAAPVFAALNTMDKIATVLIASQMDRTERLAAFLDVAACNAVEVRVPGVPDRTALFPTVRLLEHECRPSCVVSFVDSPLTHGWLPHTAGCYTQRSDPVHGPLLAPGAAALRPHHVMTRPSIAIVSAIRSIRAGEPLSIAYCPTAWLPYASRQQALLQRYHFECRCCWCDGDAPDVMRAFRCAKCERGEGAVCPRGDGSRLALWECVQCGYRPAEDEVATMLEREEQLSRVKADKAVGLAKLLGDKVLHFSHWLVLRKLDEWSEVAWRAQDSALCINILETLVKCCDRTGVGEDDKVLLALGSGAAGGAPVDEAAAMAAAAAASSSAREQRKREGGEQPDATKAQYLEFLGKVHHAIGNAHTSRDCYRRAHLARIACGQRLTWWCRVTRFMVEEKSLADLMDGK